MNESDNDGRATLTWNTPSELGRNWAPAGFDRRHNFQLGFAYALPWQSTGGYDSVVKAIVGDWQLNGVFAAFSGTPFTVTASGTSLNTPTQPAGRRPDRHVQRDRQDRRRPAPGSTRPRSRSRPASGSATRAGTSSTVPAATTSTSRCSARSRSAARSGSSSGSQAANVLNHAVFANPQGNITSGTFGQITGIGGGGSYPERRSRLGLRFSF